MGDDALPDKDGAGAVAAIMAQVCSKPTVVVLYAASYMDQHELVVHGQKLHRELELLLPACTIRLITVEGPFEDDLGNGSQFDSAALAGLVGNKLNKAFRVDLLTSCAKLLRGIVKHHPDLLIGKGQGAVIASCIRLPMIMEVVLQSQNIQRDEAHRIGSAWSRVRGVFIQSPRMSRSKVGLDLLLSACPEILKDHPVEPLAGYGIVPKITPGREDVTEFCGKFKLPVHDSMGGYPMPTVLDKPVREYWYHEGKCQCGRVLTCSGNVLSVFGRKRSIGLPR